MGDAPQRGSAQVTSGARPTEHYPIEPRLQQTEGLWPRLHIKTSYLLHSHARSKQPYCNKVPINVREAQTHDSANRSTQDHFNAVLHVDSASPTSLGGCSTEIASHLQQQQQFLRVFYVNLDARVRKRSAVPLVLWFFARFFCVVLLLFCILPEIGTS